MDSMWSHVDLWEMLCNCIVTEYHTMAYKLYLVYIYIFIYRLWLCAHFFGIDPTLIWPRNHLFMDPCLQESIADPGLRKRGIRETRKSRPLSSGAAVSAANMDSKTWPLRKSLVVQLMKGSNLLMSYLCIYISIYIYYFLYEHGKCYCISCSRGTEIQVDLEQAVTESLQHSSRAFFVLHVRPKIGIKRWSIELLLIQNELKQTQVVHDASWLLFAVVIRCPPDFTCLCQQSTKASWSPAVGRQPCWNTRSNIAQRIHGHLMWKSQQIRNHRNHVSWVLPIDYLCFLHWPFHFSTHPTGRRNWGDCSLRAPGHDWKTWCSKSLKISQ